MMRIMQKSDGALDHLDIRALRLLASILETRSVTRSAEAFALSQPAASRALDQLRRALSDRLVVRGAGGMVLTPRAEALKPLIDDALKAVGRLFAPAHFDPATSRMHVRVATTDYGAAIVLAPLAAGLASQAPAIRIEAVPWGAETFADLEAGSLDAALYADGDVPGDIHARDLFLESYSCLMRIGHPVLAAQTPDGTIPVADLARFPRAVMLFPNNRRMLADDVLGQLGGGSLQASAVFSTPYFLSGPLALEGSDLLLCVPTRAARRMTRLSALTAVDLPQAAPFTYRLIWHERSHRDPPHIWLRKAISEAVAAGAPPGSS